MDGTSPNTTPAETGAAPSAPVPTVIVVNHESPPLRKLTRKQVKDLIIPETFAAGTAATLGPVIDVGLEQAAQAAGASLLEVGNEPIAGVAARVALWLTIRGLNKWLRDETGSTAWFWKKMGRGLANAARWALDLTFKGIVIAVKGVFRRG